jgi:hypothetical protein
MEHPLLNDYPPLSRPIFRPTTKTLAPAVLSTLATAAFLSVVVAVVQHTGLAGPLWSRSLVGAAGTGENRLVEECTTTASKTASADYHRCSGTASVAAPQPPGHYHQFCHHQRRSDHLCPNHGTISTSEKDDDPWEWPLAERG